MKNDLMTDVSSLCGLRSKTHPKETPAPGRGKGHETGQGGPAGVRTPRVYPQHFHQYLGALENHVQRDCVTHPKAICETVFLICFMFLKEGKPEGLNPFKKLPLTHGDAFKMTTSPWLPQMEQRARVTLLTEL